MFGCGESKPRKGDKITIAVECVVIEATIDSVREHRGKDEQEFNEGEWFGVGFSIEEKDANTH